MKKPKHLLIIGASIALSLPFALSLIQKGSVETKALSERIFDVVYDESRTTNDDIYNNIGMFKVGFNFQYEGANTEVFSPAADGKYINTHLDEFVDSNGNPVGIGKGILVNDKNLEYWIDYDLDNTQKTAYPNTTGVHQFPMSVKENGVFPYNPVTIWFKKARIEVWVNLEVFQMDDLKITFLKENFHSFNGDYTYKLADDVTYYSTINSDAPASGKPAQKVTFVKQRNDVIANFKIESINISSEKTTDTGGRYHYYQLFTNIVRDETKFNSAVPTDHDRYMYGNILLNGKPLTHYNSYVRANKLDFTDLSDVTTQNPAYENGHATGSADIRYDLGARIDLALGANTKYIIAVYLSNQFLIDFGIDEPIFAIREGSSWFSKDAQGNSIIARNYPSMFDEKIANAINELENYVDLSLYRSDDVSAITALVYAAEGNIADAITLNEIDSILESAKTAIDEYKTDSELTEQEHIDDFLNLLNAIPATTDDEDAYIAAVILAKEAYARLSASEKGQLLDSDVDKLLIANNQAEALHLDKYKETVKAQIASEIDPEIYFDEQKASIQSLIDNANEEIDAAINRSEVDNIYDELVLAASALPTATTLANEKLDEIDLTLYRAAQRAEVEELIARGKVIISQSYTANEVGAALERILAIIALIKTDAEMTNEEALVPLKNSAKTELSDYAEAKGRSHYTVSNWQLIIVYVETGHFEIDASETEQAIATALSSAKTNIDNVETKPGQSQEEALIQAKENAQAELMTYANNKGQNNYSSDKWNELMEEAKYGCYKIEYAENEQAVSNAFSIAKTRIDLVETLEQESAKEALIAVKNNKKTELSTYANDKGQSNYSKENWALIMSYVDLGKYAIDAAENQEEINTALVVAKANIDSVKTAETDTSHDKKSSKGCGGNIAMTSLILSVVSLLGVGLILIRKSK